ncbi:MAG: hypothetical protein ACRDMV_00275 [Streptosporangiales bacterium]
MTATDREMSTYLAELENFGGSSEQAWGRLSEAEATEQSARDDLHDQAGQRRDRVDEALRRSNRARDYLLEAQERTGAADVPRQIASAGQPFPSWAAADDNLRASEHRLEQAEDELAAAERSLRAWHERRGARARWLTHALAVALTFVLVVGFLVDLGARFRFFSGMTFLLVVGGAVFIVAMTCTGAALLRHPGVTGGPPLRTTVNVDGLFRLGTRLILPIFLVLLVVRILIGIVLTVAGWFS